MKRVLSHRVKLSVYWSVIVLILGHGYSVTEVAVCTLYDGAKSSRIQEDYSVKPPREDSVEVVQAPGKDALRVPPLGGVWAQ